MANEASQLSLQELHLENRKKLTVSGVKEVESFDESVIVLQTVQGMLVIRGAGLRLESLCAGGGPVVVSGTVQSLSYEELRTGGGFFRRLFG